MGARPLLHHVSRLRWTKHLGVIVLILLLVTFVISDFQLFVIKQNVSVYSYKSDLIDRNIEKIP